MILLIALILGVFTHVHVEDGPITFTDLYGAERSASAATACVQPAGIPTLYLGDGIDLATLAHELVHVADCRDDGSMNGSPAPPRPDDRPRGISDYCWNSPIEYAACTLAFAG